MDYHKTCLMDEFAVYDASEVKQIGVICRTEVIFTERERAVVHCPIVGRSQVPLMEPDPDQDPDFFFRHFTDVTVTIGFGITRQITRCAFTSETSRDCEQS